MRHRDVRGVVSRPQYGRISVKNLVRSSRVRYGVEKIYGIKGGYRGFTSVGWDAPLELTADCVKDIQREGGTLLGTSRGGFDAEKIVEWLRAKRVNQLYVIGGDGTHRGAYKLAELCWEKGVDVSVAGVPKTIDNDMVRERRFELRVASMASPRPRERAGIVDRFPAQAHRRLRFIAGDQPRGRRPRATGRTASAS